MADDLRSDQEFASQVDGVDSGQDIVDTMASLREGPVPPRCRKFVERNREALDCFQLALSRNGYLLPMYGDKVKPKLLDAQLPFNLRLLSPARRWPSLRCRP